jgi:hypothetical protein
MNSELKNKFIELRVKGESLGAISETIGVPKTTLWRWEKEEKEHINEIQLDEQEEYEWEWRMQRHERIAELQNTIGDLHSHLIEKLGKSGHYLNTKDLILHLNLLRGELDHYRIKPLKLSAPSSHRSDEVDSDPVDNVEQNGTISLQNGTAHRSTTPSSHRKPAPLGPRTSVGNEVDSHPVASVEQNGTILLQNGTPHRSITRAASQPSLSSPGGRGTEGEEAPGSINNKTSTINLNPK